ncbi:MAG: peptidoglycan DD-metalloendopeptidase family protein [Myxococcota bacterium]|nr:peptidoglycan DD-metalloendopeptidase family protein [Myxococcota bacterium]
MSGGARLVVVLAGLLAFLPGAADADLARLEKLRKEIAESELQAREFRIEASGLLGQLEGIDRELSASRRGVFALGQRHRQGQVELRELRKRAAESEKRAASTQAALESRLLALHRWSAVRGVGGLFAAADFQSVMRREDGLRRILGADARLFALHRGARADWLAQRDRAAALVEQLEVASEELLLREERIRAQLVERRNAVALLRSRADREERLAAELREAAGRLEAALAVLPRRFEPPTGGQGLAAGTLAPPVEGRVRLSFGHQVDPEFGTEIVRNGIEISAPLGAPVRAVAPGRVLYAGWFKGYGRIVILDHGAESVTVSGYLEDSLVKAGDGVATGAVIGTVGETGSLSGPGLYFEIRSGGAPVDPETWLGSKPRGRM